MTGQSLDARAEIEDLANPLVLSGRGFHLRYLLARFGEGHAEGRPRRNQFGQALHVAHFDAQGPRDVAEGSARLERPERDDLAHRLTAVPLARVLEHLPAPFEAEIEVDVRHRDPLGIQKPLEQQVEPEGIDGGDP